MHQVKIRNRPKIGAVRQWVEALGVLCCDTMTPTEAEMKVIAYVPMLQADFPPEAFTQDSLSAVARQCKFFPAYGDVYTHLSAWWRERRPMPVALPEPMPPPRPEPTDEERAHVRELVQGLTASLKSKPLYSEETPGVLQIHDIEGRPRAHYLTPAQLDIVNPLPGGRKRVPELQKCRCICIPSNVLQSHHRRGSTRSRRSSWRRMRQPS